MQHFFFIKYVYKKMQYCLYNATNSVDGVCGIFIDVHDFFNKRNVD